MQTVLIVIHLIIVLALIVTVLLQRSEGGLGLGGGGGGGVSGFMTGRGQANALTRATAVLAALFFATSITLAIIAHHSAGPRSILDTGAGQPANQPAQSQPPQNSDNLLDTLRQQGQQEGAAATQGQPAAPGETAPPPAAPTPAAPTNAVPEAPQSR